MPMPARLITQVMAEGDENNMWGLLMQTDLHPEGVLNLNVSSPERVEDGSILDRHQTRSGKSIFSWADQAANSSSKNAAEDGRGKRLLQSIACGLDSTWDKGGHAC